MKTNYVLLCCLLPAFVISQYDFEASEEHPFGLPNPEAPKELLDFAPMIGECDCKSQSRNQDQSWAEPVDMLWRFKYIMNGMGVQDETLKSDGKHSGSIRQFIPDSTRWYVHYYNSGSPSTTLPVWEGNKNEDGKIVLYKDQKAPNGTDGFFRLTFYDITDNGFKWVGEWTDKAEKIVFPTWKIECKKKGSSSNAIDEKQQIVEAANNFSKAYMAGDLDGIMASYTKDAKIFPNNLEILEGNELKKYWAPRDNGYKTIHHKITPTTLKFFGDYAHDYGHFEGKTKRPDGTISEWRGKYVVIWKKEGGKWKMYLDIWNAIKS